MGRMGVVCWIFTVQVRIAGAANGNIDSDWVRAGLLRFPAPGAAGDPWKAGDLGRPAPVG